MLQAFVYTYGVRRQKKSLFSDMMSLHWLRNILNENNNNVGLYGIKFDELTYFGKEARWQSQNMYTFGSYISDSLYKTSGFSKNVTLHLYQITPLICVFLSSNFLEYFVSKHTQKFSYISETENIFYEVIKLFEIWYQMHWCSWSKILL